MPPSDHNFPSFEVLESANRALNIPTNAKRIVFVYTPPKVGSTSLVTTLRLFEVAASIIHIHDELMLEVLTKIKNVSINDIITYNRAILGRAVYVIDVYRDPISRKMSVFFEKICTLHFSAATPEMISAMPLAKISARFNKLWPHLALGDHFSDVYNIPDVPFDHKQKCIKIEYNGILYLKLRLRDAATHWNGILSQLFGKPIVLVADNESQMPIYSAFKRSYKLPLNFFDLIKNDVSLCKYYSPEEVAHYLREWSGKLTAPFVGFTSAEYALYDEISHENMVRSEIQLHHYIDEGCLCKTCTLKRRKIVSRVVTGGSIGSDRVIHETNKLSAIANAVVATVTSVTSRGIRARPTMARTMANTRKDFTGNMIDVVSKNVRN